MNDAIGEIVVVDDGVAITLQQVRDLLERAKTADDVLDLKAGIEAVTLLSKRRDLSAENEWLAREMHLRCNRRLGEITAALPKATPGRKPAAAVATSDSEIVVSPPTISKGAALKAAKLPAKTAARCEALAKIPDHEFEARLEQERKHFIEGKRAKSIAAVTSAAGHDGDMFSTPAKYVEAARKVIGLIELDPATNPSAQRVVCAQRFYTRETDGLAQSWRSPSVWLNPPYSRDLIGPFIDKLLAELDGIGAAIALVNTDNSASWYQALLGACTAFCLLGKRIAFELEGEPVKGNAHPQTFFYFGPKLPAFARAFAAFGAVCIVHKHARKPQQREARP